MTSNALRAIASCAACGQQMAKASCAWKTATTPISTTCGRHSQIPGVWPAGSARWKATCDSAVSSARTSLPVEPKVPGRVEACEPPQRLLLLTKHVDATYELVIEATLTADGDQTILVVEERGMPLELLHGYGAGIQIHFEHLAAHIAGRERSGDAEARWEQLLPAYQALVADVS